MKNVTRNTHNGGNAMTRFTAMILLSLAMSLGACAPTDTVSIDGPVPVTTENGDPMGNHVANWDPNQCWTNADCGYDQLCVLDLMATQKLGFDAMRCVVACNAEFETVNFEDGTSKVVKVEDSDTCQRFGDEEYFCDMDAADGPTCVEYTDEPGPCTECQTPQEPEEPTEPETPVEPQPEYYSITCCFNPGLYGNGQDFRVNFGGGVVEPSLSGGLHWNIVMDENGCGTSTGFYRMDNVTLGFWTELTNGPVSDNHDNWLGSGANGEYEPISCTVNDVEYGVGNQVQGCGFGTYDAFDAESGQSLDCHGE